MRAVQPGTRSAGAFLSTMLRGLFTRQRGIRSKFVVAFLILASVPLLIAGVYGTVYSIRILEEATLEHLEYELSSKANEIEKFLNSVHRDVLYLSRSNTLKELLEAEGRLSRSELEPLRLRVEREFLSFSSTRPYYYQIRYIDNSGYEVVRVNSDGRSSIAVPIENLQFKGDRYYFKESLGYPKEQCYVSRMDLNVERGQVEYPFKPVVRFATPVFDKRGEKGGIVIINLYASYLISQIKSLNIARGGTTFLVNREGFYLSHLNSEGVESRFFDFGSTEGLKKDYSDELVKSILSGKPGTVSTDTEIISYAPIFTGDNVSKRFWVLTLVYPKKAIFSSIIRLEILYIIIGLFAVLSALFIAMWMAKRFTDPILKLHKGVEWISEGDFDHKMDIRTGDEIETLADRFNTMADRLKAFRERMAEWNEELKREVENRTRELELEKNKIENILMCATEGIIVADENDRIIIINPAAESILNVRRQDMLGKTIFGCHKRPDMVRAITTGRSGYVPRTFTTTINSKALEISVAVIVYDGRKSGSMMVMRDITERQRLIEERMTMERQLFHADKLVSLGELSAGIAHEIGNPLAAIKTVIQAMDEEVPILGEQKKYMKRILKEVDRLALFLKTFSAFANPGVKPSARTKITQVLQDVVFLIRNEALKKNIDISYATSLDTHVMMDSDHLKQIFMNLLLNAIQAIDRGGRIVISTELLNSGMAKITVADTGPGIPEENLKKIFNPFFTTKPAGTGLGLSIVHRIIKEHNGDINVKSKIGEGTTFEVILPVDGRIT